MYATKLNLLPHGTTGPESHALGDRSAHICLVDPGYALKEEQIYRVKTSVSVFAFLAKNLLCQTQDFNFNHCMKGLDTIRLYGWPLPLTSFQIISLCLTGITL